MSMKLKALTTVVMIGVVGSAFADGGDSEWEENNNVVIIDTLLSGGGSSLTAPMYRDALPMIGQTQYAVTGSGVANNTFLTNDPSLFYSALTSVDFVASSIPLSTAQLDTYNLAYNNGIQSTVADYGPLLQIPVAVTPVVLSYNNPDIQTLALNSQQICQLFAHQPQAQTWGQIMGNGDPTPINVVYRQDSSGTTALLADYLTGTCPAYGLTDFVASSVMTEVVANYSNSQTPEQAWGWSAVDGNVDASITLASQPGSLSYMGPADSYVVRSGNVASVDGYDPSALMLNDQPPVVTVTVKGDKPAALKEPVNGYPIYGTTQLVVSQCYADQEVGEAVRQLVQYLQDGTFDSQIRENHLYPLPGSWRDAIQAMYVTGASADGLFEVNGAVCANHSGRPAH